MKLLLIDVSNIAFRSWHAMKQLKHDGLGTGAVFGVLRAILQLQGIHSTKNIMFAFDSAESLRKEVYPEYKANRVKSDPDIYRQINLLHEEILPMLGFRNICSLVGYEADDVIAMCIKSKPFYKHIIVSTDTDFYQLLSKSVSIWNPATKILIGPTYLYQTHRCSPKQWVTVKAMCGCKSDNVTGIVGVAEMTAVKYIKAPDTRQMIHMRIRNSAELIARNRVLVELPYKGGSPEPFNLHEDQVVNTNWYEVIDRYGLYSLNSQVVGKY